MCLFPRVAMDRSQKLMNSFVTETSESACICICNVIINITKYYTTLGGDIGWAANLYCNIYIYIYIYIWWKINGKSGYTKNTDNRFSSEYFVLFFFYWREYFFSWEKYFLKFSKKRKWIWVYKCENERRLGLKTKDRKRKREARSRIEWCWWLGVVGFDLISERKKGRGNMKKGEFLMVWFLWLMTYQPL